MGVPICFLTMQTRILSEGTGLSRTGWLQGQVIHSEDLHPNGETVPRLLPHTQDNSLLKKKKKKERKKATCFISSSASFRKTGYLCYQTRIYISCWYTMNKSTYPKNSLSLKRKKNLLLISKKSYSFGLSAEGSNLPGCDKPRCQFSSSWFG